MSGVVGKPSGSRFFIALLAAAVVLRIAAAFWMAGETELTVWGDRDLWRALTALSQWPVAGPEINGGLRPPGGVFYLLLAGILAIEPSALAAHIGLLTLFGASILLLGLMLARDLSVRTGMFAAAALAGAPMLDEVLKVWNPGFLLFFATAATIFGTRYLRHGGALALGLASAAVAIGLQIHLQIFQLAVALAIAALIRRPGWSRWHTLALVLGWGLPYLPALATGAPHLLALAAPVPGEAVDNYMLWEFHPLEKAQLVYGMLGGTPQIAAVITGGQMTGASILPILGDLLAVLLVLTFVVRWLRRRPSGTEGRQSHRALALALLLVIAVYLVVALASSVNARHLVAVWPAVAMITGIAADTALRRLESALPPGAAFAASAVLFLALAARPVSLAATTLTRDSGGLDSLAAQTEIAATAKTAFYAGHEAFDAHAALFSRPGGRIWQMGQEGISGQMDFVYQTTPAQPLASDRTECLAIVPKQFLAAGIPVDLAKAAAFTGLSLSPSIAPMAAESAHFAYFPYTTADGNCLKSFPNAYIPTRFETAHLTPDAAPAASSSAGAAQFAANLPEQRFPIGLEVRGDDGRYLAVLHGRLLRGYTGLHFATIVNPALCLSGPDGIHVVPVARGTVGSPQHGSLAPWQSPRFALADGEYRLWLVGRDGKRPRFLQIPLGHISLPDLGATAPGADMEAPPAGCPAPPSAGRAGG